MTLGQERAITLALNILHTGFFECPRHDYQYFVTNDEWALLLTAAGASAADASPPPQLAVAALGRAVAREGFFDGMTDFQPPTHYCSFLRDKVARGERALNLEPCKAGQTSCPYATFENIRDSK